MTKVTSGKHFSIEEGYKSARNYSDYDQILYEVVKELRDTIRGLEARIVAQESEITALKSGDGGGVSFASMLKGNGKATVETAAVVKLMNMEQKQVEDRSKSITVNGLAETENDGDDMNTVKSVLDSIKCNTAAIVRVRRVGVKAAATTQTPKPRTIVVELDSEKSRSVVIRSAVKLKDSNDYKDVFIKPDMSDNQRLAEFELRKSRNERNDMLPLGEGRQRYAIDKNNQHWYWGIRWGELRQINKADNRAFKPAM